MAMALGLRWLGKGGKTPKLGRLSLFSSSYMSSAADQHHEIIRKFKQEINEELDKALSIEKECPYANQISERFFHAKDDYATLNSYLQDLRRFNLENKDAPKVKQMHHNFGLTYSSANLPCFDYDNAFPPKVRDKIALQVAPLIVDVFKHDLSDRCGEDLNMEFVRVVEESKTDDWFIHRAVVEATNPLAHDAAAAAAAGLPTTSTIKLEATYHVNYRTPHTPKLIIPPSSPSPSLEAQTSQEAETDNVTASTQAGCDPVCVDTKRCKFYVVCGYPSATLHSFMV